MDGRMDGFSDCLPDWRTDRLPNWVTDGLTYWLRDGRTDGWTDWRTYWLTDWRMDWLIDWPTDGRTDLLTDRRTDEGSADIKRKTNAQQRIELNWITPFDNGLTKQPLRYIKSFINQTDKEGNRSISTSQTRQKSTWCEGCPAWQHPLQFVTIRGCHRI